jgi:hypothetical protein
VGRRILNVPGGLQGRRKLCVVVRTEAVIRDRSSPESDCSTIIVRFAKVTGGAVSCLLTRLSAHDFGGVGAEQCGDKLSGPMVPYLALEERHRNCCRRRHRPSLAGAGAKQAVDQIFDVVRFKSVTNLKGDLPDGYRSAVGRAPAGIGRVTKQSAGRNGRSRLRVVADLFTEQSLFGAIS